MVASKHAIQRVLRMLENGPLTKDQIANRLQAQLHGRTQPTSMELVGMLKPYNGIKRREDGKYELA